MLCRWEHLRGLTGSLGCAAAAGRVQDAMISRHALDMQSHHLKHTCRHFAFVDSTSWCVPGHFIVKMLRGRIFILRGCRPSTNEWYNIIGLLQSSEPLRMNLNRYCEIVSVQIIVITIIRWRRLLHRLFDYIITCRSSLCSPVHDQQRYTMWLVRHVLHVTFSRQSVFLVKGATTFAQVLNHVLADEIIGPQLTLCV